MIQVVERGGFLQIGPLISKAIHNLS